MDRSNLACRVCGYLYGAPPWGEDGKSPEHWICPCCGCEAGYEDCQIMSASRYRQRWIEKGMPWFAPKEKPEQWDAQAQMANIPKEFLWDTPMKFFSSIPHLIKTGQTEVIDADGFLTELVFGVLDNPDNRLRTPTVPEPLAPPAVPILAYGGVTSEAAVQHLHELAVYYQEIVRSIESLPYPYERAASSFFDPATTDKFHFYQWMFGISLSLYHREHLNEARNYGPSHPNTAYAESFVFDSNKESKQFIDALLNTGIDHEAQMRNGPYEQITIFVTQQHIFINQNNTAADIDLGTYRFSRRKLRYLLRAALARVERVEQVMREALGRDYLGFSDIG